MLCGIMQRYNVVKPLGDGAFGEVYLAVDKKTQEKVAIKRIKKRCVHAAAVWDAVDCVGLAGCHAVTPLQAAATPGCPMAGLAGLSRSPRASTECGIHTAPPLAILRQVFAFRRRTGPP